MKGVSLAKDCPPQDHINPVIHAIGVLLYHALLAYRTGAVAADDPSRRQLIGPCLIGSAMGRLAYMCGEGGVLSWLVLVLGRCLT